MNPPSWRSQRGSALWLAWPGLAFTTVMLVLIVDLAAYLVAMERARAAADLTALAAAGVTHPEIVMVGDPVHQARRVATANGAELISCACASSSGGVEVVVSVEVRAVAVNRFAGRRVQAAARAALVEVAPDRSPPYTPTGT